MSIPPHPSTQSGESSRHSWPNLDAFPYTKNQTIQRVSSWLLATWHPTWKSPCGWLPAHCGLVFLHGQAAAKGSSCSHQHGHSCISSGLLLGHRAPRGCSSGLQPGAAVRAHTDVLGETCWMLNVWQDFCELLAEGWKWSPYYRWSKAAVSLEKSTTCSEEMRETEITSNIC